MFGLEIILVVGFYPSSDFEPGVSEKESLSEREIQENPNKKRYCFYSESKDVTQDWFSMLSRCTLTNHFCCKRSWTGRL